MAKLYELRNEYEELFMQLGNFVDENGEVNSEFTDKINSLTDDIQEKAVSVGVYTKRIKSDIETYKGEIERLTAEKKKLEKALDFYKNYLSGALKTAEIDNINDVKVKISFRKSEKLTIAENADIPLDYMSVKVEPNKTALKEAIKGGRTFNGVTIEQCNNIQIK